MKYVGLIVITLSLTITTIGCGGPADTVQEYKPDSKAEMDAYNKQMEQFNKDSSKYQAK